MSIYSCAHGHEHDGQLSPAPTDRRVTDVKATQQLHEQGHRLWLDNIAREMLDSD
jgi:hypothetical protein